MNVLRERRATQCDSENDTEEETLPTYEEAFERRSTNALSGTPKPTKSEIGAHSLRNFTTPSWSEALVNVASPRSPQDFSFVFKINQKERSAVFADVLNAFNSRFCISSKARNATTATFASAFNEQQQEFDQKFELDRNRYTKRFRQSEVERNGHEKFRSRAFRTSLNAFRTTAQQQLDSYSRRLKDLAVGEDYHRVSLEKLLAAELKQICMYRRYLSKLCYNC